MTDSGSNPPIRWRLVIGIILILAVVMTLLTASLAWNQRRELHQEFVETALDAAKALAPDSAGIAAGDVADLEKVLASRGRIPSLSFIMALSPAGEVLAHSGHLATDREMAETLHQRLRTAQTVPQVLTDDWETFVIVCPIMHEKALAGWVLAAFSKEDMNRQLWLIVLWSGLLWTVAVMAAGLALTLTVTHGLTRGIAQLLTVAQAFKDGDETIRASLNRRGDELGKLGAATNGMFDAIVRERYTAGEGSARLDRTLREYKAMAVSWQEAKEAIQQLATEKERLLVTLSAITEGVITCDRRGAVTLMNSVAERLTGWSLAEAQGREAKEVIRLLGPDGAPLVENPLEKAMDEGCVLPLPAEVRLVSRDDLSRPVAGSCAPIRENHEVSLGQTNQPVGGIFVFHDTSAEEAAHERMFETRKLESLSVFAGGLAHDFNNILTSILGNIDMARDGADPESALMLSDAENAVQRAKRLTDQLLTFAKGGEPVRQGAQIEEVIRETCRFVLAGSRTRVRFEIPNDIHAVYMDSAQISQVIQNIVLNAVQAMEKSGGEITISCANCHIGRTGDIDQARCAGMGETLPLAAGDYVRVSVADSGPGIPATNLSRIFDPYFTTKVNGHGLGLAICQSIIRNHNGYIDVTASPDQGTMFTFWLPVSHERETPSDTASGDAEIQASTGVILIMDDDEIILEVVSRILHSAGYTTLFAQNGREAIALYGEHLAQGKPIDCVLLDLTVPGCMGGKNAMEAILSLDPQAKGIVSSGYAGDPVMVDYQRYGFAAAISKPFSMTELLAVIHKVLTAKRN